MSATQGVLRPLKTSIRHHALPFYVDGLHRGRVHAKPRQQA